MPAVVAFSRCLDYAPDAVAAAVRAVLDALGGIARFVRPGQTVLLKPNLLSDRTPDQAITTHPEVVRALIRVVKAAGARPVVADSPAIAVKIERVWELTGFRALCAEEDAPLLNLEKAGSRPFTIGGVPVSIAAPVLNAEVVINVPKLKTHSLTVLTHAVKNVFGTIPGFQKAMLHKTFPRPRAFGAFLAAYYAHLKPALTIGDAVLGMDGEGPSAGSPVPLGFLAGSADGVALDAAVCRLLKIPPARVPYLAPLRQANVGEQDPAAIRLAGESPDGWSLPPFRLPRARLPVPIPDWAVRLIGPSIWIRPFFNEACESCGLCVKACPATALTMAPRHRPVVDGRRCIECCCCHEVCPAKAIEMRASPLLRLLSRGKILS